eukprot:848404_1
MNETHEKELNEINALLNQLSNQFDSLKSSAANSPHKHTEGMTAPSSSDKVQCFKTKLHIQFRKQKEKHQLLINEWNISSKHIISEVLQEKDDSIIELTIRREMIYVVMRRLHARLNDCLIANIISNWISLDEQMHVLWTENVRCNQNTI